MPSVDARQGIVELAPLVGHLGHAHARDARGGQSRLAGHCGDRESLLVGIDRRIQATLGPLDQAEMMTAHGGQARSPAARQWAMIEDKPRSASGTRPRSHSATPRCAWTW
jgi:hypothetical protein